MKLFVAKETTRGEPRIPMVPLVAAKLVKLGAEVIIESGLGKAIRILNGAFTEVGATTSARPAEALAEADVVIRLHKPSAEAVTLQKRGSIHISYLDPFNSPELVKAFAAAGVTAVSLEMIPRTTLAQKMDVLSSQASLGGYAAVIQAADALDKILPMMMTPAGTIAPARVLVIGAGVAGLQAIATAKRLGARVDAFDTRPVVAEQVESLGARFVKVDLGETGQTRDGYAKALTEAQLEIQRQAMAKSCAQADIVITTAQLFGRPAPRIITDDMLKGMRKGSIIVDMAVESGGNVEGAKLGKETTVHGVRILGQGNLPARVAVHASEMYASNIGNFVEHFWNKATNLLELNPEDEIVQGCVMTRDGEIVHPVIKERVQ